MAVNESYMYVFNKAKLMVFTSDIVYFTYMYNFFLHQLFTSLLIVLELFSALSI